jgi:RHS repeat-associated protein
MVYPNGRTIDYPDRSGFRGLEEAAQHACRFTAPLNSGSNNNSAVDNAIGRLDAIVDGANSGDAGQVLEQYSYLGLSTIVARNHPQTNINLTYVNSSGPGGPEYPGLDQFGRVVNQNWINSSTGAFIQDIFYSYDANSNSTGAYNRMNNSYSQYYTYDPLNRLSSYSQPGSPSQSWTLDAQGNWSSYTSNGTTQTQTANAQNQITSISGTAGTPVYDANGNMTTDQSGNTYVYNAWNQLVSVKNASGKVIAQYTYDARGYRVTESYPLGGNGVATGTVNYIYYDSQWQAIETRTNGTANSNVTSQTVWSAAYINAAIMQDTYSAGVIQPNSRIYFLQDMNWNTTAIVGYNSTTGTWGVTQRYVYSPYGSITVLNADWTTPPTGTQPVVNNLYQGMTLDSVTGLYYARNRNYSPSLGRWINQDPAGYINGANTYQFVMSNPVGNVDPMGLAGVSDDVNDEGESGSWWEALWSDLFGGELYQGPPIVTPTGGVEPPWMQAIDAARAERVARGGPCPVYDNPATPKNARDTLAFIDQTGQAPPGYRGGKPWENDGRQGGQVLPKSNSNGPINYREWDVNPYTRGINRGQQRLVTGSDGSAYYTDNHYGSFTRLR